MGVPCRSSTSCAASTTAVARVASESDRAGIQPRAQLALLGAGQLGHRGRVAGLALDQGEGLQHGVVQVGGDVGALGGAGQLGLLVAQVGPEPQPPRGGDQGDAGEDGEHGRADVPDRGEGAAPGRHDDQARRARAPRRTTRRATLNRLVPVSDPSQRPRCESSSCDQASTAPAATTSSGMRMPRRALRPAFCATTTSPTPSISPPTSSTRVASRSPVAGDRLRDRRAAGRGDGLRVGRVDRTRAPADHAAAGLRASAPTGRRRPPDRRRWGSRCSTNAQPDPPHRPAQVLGQPDGHPGDDLALRGSRCRVRTRGAALCGPRLRWGDGPLVGSRHVLILTHERSPMPNVFRVRSAPFRVGSGSTLMAASPSARTPWMT